METVDVQVGEVWAYYPDDYRPNASRVEILEIVPRPKKDRYLIRFEDGREREVARTRLKCRWEDAHAYEEKLAAEELIRNQAQDSRLSGSIRRVFRLVPREVATLEHSGQVVIHDTARLAARTGVPMDVLLTACGQVAEGSSLRVSALGGQRIAMALCVAHPAEALRIARGRDSQADHYDDDERPGFFSPRRDYRWYADEEAPAGEIIRSWCGALPTARAEAAAAAEAECHRLWLLAHRLVNELAKHALPVAENLRKDLVNNQISADDVRAA